MPSTIRVATYNLYLGADVTVVFGVSSPEELAQQIAVVADHRPGPERPELRALVLNVRRVIRVLATPEAIGV